jgi:hypothetical protein
MTQPTIITAQSTGYAADSDASSTTRTYSNVAIPANANTVVIWVTGDTTEDFESFTNITYGDSAAVRTHLVDVSSAAPRMMMASVFDVSSAGALTDDVTATFATAASVNTRLGIVCTTGFLESFFSTQDRSAQEGQSITFSSNYENNLFVLCNAADDFDGGWTYTTGTQIFQSTAGGTAVGVAAASQATNLSDGSKKIAYTAPTEEVTDFGVLFSTQRNPFATNFGPVIRPIISHDVIS